MSTGSALRGGDPGPQAGISEWELGLLTGLVEIPSPTGRVERATGWLAERLSEIGIRYRVDGAGNLVAAVTPGSGSPSLGPLYLLGHIDTVEGFWEPRLERGRLSGRGASDAKGPLAAFVAAVRRARDQGLLRRPVLILAVADEEGRSEGARQLARSLEAPSYLVVGEPSGGGRVVIGYRGRLRCQVTLGSPVGHSSRPEPTAAELAFAAWREITGLVEELNGSAIGFEALDVHLLEIGSSSDGLRSQARLGLSFRLPPGLGPEQLVGRVRQRLPGAELAVEGGDPAVTVPRTGPLPTAFARAIREQGQAVAWQRRLATSDLNVVLPTWRCPAVVYGPGDPELDHSPDESIRLDDYRLAIEVLTRVLSQL